MKHPILILHGWGLTASTYKDVLQFLISDGFDAFTLELPGFGAEPLVHDAMTLDDYVEFVDAFVQKRKLKKIILIGHSFGARVGLKYTYTHPEKVFKLVLTGVPIIRHRTIKKWIAYNVALLGGRIFGILPVGVVHLLRKILYFAIGEWDYYKAGPLKKVFKNIIGEDLTAYAQKITVPVMIVWGEDDRITPKTDVEKIKKLILHARSVIIPSVGHKLPYERPEKFFKAIKPFL